jgi:hypothetical protein
VLLKSGKPYNYLENMKKIKNKHVENKQAEVGSC